MEIKNAVASAIVFATDALGTDRTRDIRLEEVESSLVDGRPIWLITLSSPVFPKPAGANFRQMMGPANPLADREFKVFSVAKDSGEVLAMRIRIFALAS